jgi:hypothetical protein
VLTSYVTETVALVAFVPIIGTVAVYVPGASPVVFGTTVSTVAVEVALSVALSQFVSVA